MLLIFIILCNQNKKMMKKIFLLALVAVIGNLHAQNFTQVSTSITPLIFASADFADFDNDGDQDLAVIGVNGNFVDVAKIYRNDDGVFNPVTVNLSPMHMGAVSWVDYDSDGDYDLFISGQDYAMNAFAIIYKNTDGNFSPSSVSLPAGFWNSAGWGDFDNDGDLDLAYSWYSETTAHSAIFKNGNGVFSDINANLPGMTAGSMEWGDYDKDGDLDLLFTGTYTDFSQTPVKIYKNNGGVFVDILAGFMDCAWYNNALWNDVDNDGDLDIVYVADGESGYPFIVYKNNAGSFELINTGLFGVRTSNGNIAVVTGDIDNDGDMDVIMTGDDPNYIKSTKIFINNNGTFSNLEHSIPGFGSGTIELADIDNDGDLDIFAIGYDEAGDAGVGIFMNDANTNTYSSNLSPDAPANLFSEVNGNELVLNWSASADDHTPTESLQYNIYIGSNPGMGDILTAQSVINPESESFGFHYIPKPGNAGMNLQYEIPELADGIYYWSVQAFDQSGMASVFAEEEVFEIGNSTGVDHADLSTQIFPNPASDWVFIETSKNLQKIEVFNMLGELLIHEDMSSQTHKLDMSYFTNGYYIFKITTTDQTLIEQIQVSR